MNSKIGDKYVLLCGGFQKAGTTWMDKKWLSKHPEIHRDIVKEFHVLDSVFSDDTTVRKIGSKEKLKELEGLANDLYSRIDRGRKSKELNEEEQNSGLLFHFIANPSSYFDYFENVLLKIRGKRFAYDFTTEHCFIGFRGWIKILEEFARRGIKVKILCMIRDPIERIHSAVRMKAEALHGEYWKQSDEEEILRKFSKDKLFQHRTKYETKIPIYQEIVGKENVFTVFYEEIFNGADEFTELCTFLQISHIKPDITERVNESKFFYRLTDLARGWLLNEYQATYDWAEKAFGRDRVRNIWHCE